MGCQKREGVDLSAPPTCVEATAELHSIIGQPPDPGESESRGGTAWWKDGRKDPREERGRCYRAGRVQRMQVTSLSAAAFPSSLGNVTSSPL